MEFYRHKVSEQETIRYLTSEIIGQRFKAERERIEMGRLEDKMAQAAGVAERVTSDLESRADAVIAREAPIINRAKAWSEAKSIILDDAERAIAKAERALAILSNDPLPRSEDIQKPPPEVGAAVQSFQSS